MKKSLLLLAMCLTSVGMYAQDDDVYFVPSSKDKVQSNDTYTANPGRSSYTPISSDDSAFSSSNWADGRGNGKWDVDAYNRRGRNYKQQLPDTLTSQQTYDQGYSDGYEDGSCTARIVRFGSPRAGVIVSSPFYWDYYDLCYDPFYYGYGSPWSWGWSGWYGWGSWYGWRPYYSSWSWGWGSPWYDPWYDPWYGPGWGGGHHWAWHPAPLPANAQRGPVGGWTARGGARGAGSFTGNTSTSRGYGMNGRSYGVSSNRSFGNGSTGTRSFGTGSTGTRSFGTGSTGTRSFGTTPSNSNRSWNNSNRSNTNSNSNRTYSQPSQPSRSSFGGGSSVGGGRGFGGGGSMGGSRGFGGGGGSRGGGRSFGR